MIIINDVEGNEARNLRVSLALMLISNMTVCYFDREKRDAR